MVAAAKKAHVVNMVCHNYRRIPAIALGEKDDRRRRPRRPDLSLPRPLRAGLDRRSEFPARLAVAGQNRRQRRAWRHRRAHHRSRPLPRRRIQGSLRHDGNFHQGAAARGTSRRGPRRGKGRKKMGKVTVDDAVSWIGRFNNGALANLEATRFALGRKNHIALEINGSKGSLAFNFEDMNRLEFYNNDDPADRHGFRSILVTERSQPYAGAWWPPGHIIGYEHTFVNAFADFVKAVVAGKSVQPTFRRRPEKRARSLRDQPKRADEKLGKSLAATFSRKSRRRTFSSAPTSGARPFRCSRPLPTFHWPRRVCPHRDS